KLQSLVDAGTHPESYYDKLLHPTSAQLRRYLLSITRKETRLLAKIQDLLCLPRPISPPIRRLSVGSHHLEYGFPSTHATNAVSIALYFLTSIYAVESSNVLKFVAVGMIIGSWNFSKSGFSNNGDVPYDYNSTGLVITISRIIL
ncbi:27529_t:CDS:2, partial [Racocetra persica]